MSIWDRDPTTELAAIRKRIRSGYHGTGGKGLAKRDLWYAMNLIDRGLVPRIPTVENRGESQLPESGAAQVPEST